MFVSLSICIWVADLPSCKFNLQALHTRKRWSSRARSCGEGFDTGLGTCFLSGGPAWNMPVDWLLRVAFDDLGCPETNQGGLLHVVLSLLLCYVIVLLMDSRFQDSHLGKKLFRIHSV